MDSCLIAFFTNMQVFYEKLYILMCEFFHFSQIVDKINVFGIFCYYE